MEDFNQVLALLINAGCNIEHSAAKLPSTTSQISSQSFISSQASTSSQVQSAQHALFQSSQFARLPSSQAAHVSSSDHARISSSQLAHLLSSEFAYFPSSQPPSLVSSEFAYFPSSQPPCLVSSEFECILSSQQPPSSQPDHVASSQLVYNSSSQHGNDPSSQPEQPFDEFTRQTPRLRCAFPDNSGPQFGPSCNEPAVKPPILIGAFEHSVDETDDDAGTTSKEVSIENSRPKRMRDDTSDTQVTEPSTSQIPYISKKPRDGQVVERPSKPENLLKMSPVRVDALFQPFNPSPVNERDILKTRIKELCDSPMFWELVRMMCNLRGSVGANFKVHQVDTIWTELSEGI
jgi:hypothetical protein